MPRNGAFVGSVFLFGGILMTYLGVTRFGPILIFLALPFFGLALGAFIADFINPS